MDEALLQYYTKQWIRYTTAARVVNNIFMYLNRYWVKREIDEDRKNDVYDVFTVSVFVERQCQKSSSLMMVVKIVDTGMLEASHVPIRQPQCHCRRSEAD